MTWTVESNSSVVGDGAPESVVATYSNSYQRGQVRAGDEALLTLSELGGMTIEKAELFLRSNKSSGAGEITVTVDGNLVSTISGTFKDWTGAYDNTDYHAVQVLFEQYMDVHTMEIKLVGTTNSLYIEKYVLTYSAAPVYNVTLMHGNDVHAVQTEEMGGAGVVLPVLADSPEWQFIGWSEREFWAIHELPEVLAGGQRYYPKTDITLWSVWKTKDAQDQAYVADLQSGVYLYANRETGMALSGIPQNGKMDANRINIDNENLFYYIDFLSPDTATILHVPTQTYIGYSGTKVAANNKPWLVSHEGDHTVFYIRNKEKNYALWLNVWDSEAQTAYAGLQLVSDLSSPMGLLPARTQSDEPTYTCHPEHDLAVDVVKSDKKEVVIPFGTYEIHIIDGKKYIHLHN